ncbi:hypothetical protein BGZ49_001052 [Haplosporangium sp. Z 27]|nr:hypothetical protein BGZ49_001052 [Haplosporangium sp. Z 27]
MKPFALCLFTLLLGIKLTKGLLFGSNSLQTKSLTTRESSYYGTAKHYFKDPNILISKLNFTGDPEQASWVSEFDHIVSYANVDQELEKLLLHSRKDKVMTQSGGGFGATVSSTRWSKYGTFSAKLKSGSSGPGIVTAFLLSNPALGEQISFELTGKNPKKVITNYYRRVPALINGELKEPGDSFHSVTHSQSSYRLESHEEVHDLKHDTTEHELIYKIEWNEGMIRWSIGNKVLRVVRANDITTVGGLPTNAMQLQLTIWDVGHAIETSGWAGGKSFYGVGNSGEYVASVSAVEIICQDPSEGNKPWPGPEALNRLQLAQTRTTPVTYGYQSVKATRAKDFFKISILSLIKWTLVLLSMICGAAYFTEPKPKITRATVPISTSQAMRNIDLQRQQTSK